MHKLLMNVEDIVERLEYKETEIKGKPKWNLKKKGQYKLLLSEIRFLSMEACIQDLPKGIKITVLYIGSGKGYHIPTLISMYSRYDITWVLYDPNGHCESLKESEKLIINNKFFTEEDVEQYKNVPNLFFISDIRSTNSTNDQFVDDSPTTENLLDDYMLQNSFLRSLKPMFSLLKFRMPFPTDWDDSWSFEKPLGKNCLQCFHPLSSSEYRIFTSGIPLFTIVDNIEVLKESEEKFYWFNKVYRNASNYDTRMAFYIMNHYLKVENSPIRIHESNILDYLRTFKFE